MKGKTMKIAITGGTGFIGRHLGNRLAAEGHEVLLMARRNRRLSEGLSTSVVTTDLSNPGLLAEVIRGCDAVAHCAGINRELGSQTYRRVHIEGTRNVLAAARQAGVKKVVLMSFLRARPNCGSPYHESKWMAEESVRNSGIDFTIIRAGIVYGRGDHMLDHLSRALYTFPLFAMVGLKEKEIRPLAVEDLVRVMRAAIVDNRLNRQTIAVTGPEQLYLSEAVNRVAAVIGRKARMVPAPLWFHYSLAYLLEFSMKIPLIARAQVRILSEGVIEPALPSDPLPYDLTPTIRFTDRQIRQGLPAPGGFRVHDLRCCV
jgi:uncharacterized protein YbjT (DUF2867 family)